VDVEGLEDYLLLLDAGSFSRAAERRNLSQPAFSRRIMALESWVGTPLLVRGSHKLTTTPAGERFRTFSEELLRRIYSGRTEVREIGASSRTEIRFASTPALSLAYFSRWVKDVEADRPLESMVLSVDTMTACERQLVQGEVHFVLCHHHKDITTPLDTSQFHFVRLDDDPLVPLSAPNPDGSPLFELSDTAKSPIKFLNYTRESGLWRILDGVRQKNPLQVSLEQVFASHSSMVLAAMARDGRGVAWVPRSFAQPDIAAGRLVAAGDAQWEIAAEIRLIRPRDRQSEAAERFWSAVLKRRNG
jgi:DNA-binding transcriptional LysR family regulator